MNSQGTARTARALEADLREARRHAEVVSILMGAHFPWAEPHKRTVARDLAERIADYPHVTPMLAAYVVQSIDDAGKGRDKAGHSPLNPIAMLIVRTGTETPKAGRKPRPAVDVPLWFAQRWGQVAERKVQISQAQEALNALRNRPVAGPSVSVAGGS